MPKTILVTGDVFTFQNLLPSPEPGPAPDRLPRVSLQSTPAGAARLASIAQEAIGALATVVGPEHSIPAPKTSKKTATAAPPHEPWPAAFVRWAAFLEETGKKKSKDEERWRVQEYCGIPNSPQPTLVYSQAVPDPDILLIDDCALGFRDQPSAWPAALTKGKPASIILHTCSPLCDGPLWRHLIEHHGDRLTVITSVAALRQQGAAVGSPLSWDKTIEEIATFMGTEGRVRDLPLAKRIVIAIGTGGAASFTREPIEHGDSGLTPRARFERCFYDPANLEDAYQANMPGLHLDATSSILAAALSRYELDSTTYPLFIAFGRGLAASRAAHYRGAGSAKAAALDLDGKEFGKTLNPAGGEKEPAAQFYTAYPHTLLDLKPLRDQPATQSDLLQDFTGAGYEAVLSTAVDVVLRGPEVSLKAVPRASIGDYFTVDREECERINALRNLIVTYLNNPEDKRPLSVAVFGPPGSGKSFAIKQLVKAISEGSDPLEFNLSQFRGDPSDLHQAFHRVRDASIKNYVPFVFWDEFDTQGLIWLKDFLAPMQDSVFQEGGVDHAFGKTVFIFAGGTAESFAKFNSGTNAEHFRQVKGPDFVSRLRGYLNIKGPNPELDAEGKPVEVAYLIRRAMILRNNLKKHAPGTLQTSKEIAADASLVRSLLAVGRYEHGARSMDAVISMSNLGGASWFGSSALPSMDLLRLHVSADFMCPPDDVSLGGRDIEALAAATHDAFRKQRAAQGYVYGPTRNNKTTPPTHPKLLPFENLDHETQESNRAAVRSTLVALETLGYRLRWVKDGLQHMNNLDGDELLELMRVEHDRWLRERLQSGWAFGPRNDGLRLNDNIVHFDELDLNETPLDELTVKAILPKLPELGYFLVRPEN